MAADIILNNHEIILKGLKVSVQKNMVIGTGQKITSLKDSGILTNMISVRSSLKAKKMSVEAADIGVLNIASSVREELIPGKITIGKGSSRTLLTDKEIRCKKFTTLSDARCKQDITSLADSLGKINALQGVSFNWKDNVRSGRNQQSQKQIGFLAQDVEKILPESVSEDENGQLSVDYISLIPLLVEGMKTQQENLELQSEEITSISEENKILNSRVSNAEHRLSDLEKKLASLISH